VGYGVERHTADGTNLESCLNTLAEAIGKARGGAGPQMIVADLLRLCGHGEHDDSSYVDSRFKSSTLGRDCLKVTEERLLADKWANVETIAAWRNEAAARVEEAVATVQREPGPDPFKENWCALSSAHLSEGHDE
jgi:pyruvate dehydrogenase E1 component alpha subunit/2-oxoisovalerate dehydrogenase E1 component alpha subunit